MAVPIDVDGNGVMNGSDIKITVQADLSADFGVSDFTVAVA